MPSSDDPNDPDKPGKPVLVSVIVVGGLVLFVEADPVRIDIPRISIQLRVYRKTDSMLDLDSNIDPDIDLELVSRKV